MSDLSTGDGELLAWCVVANVASETAHGEGGQDARQGLKHFAPGAKVWVLPPQWGDGGENVFVIGRHRGRSQGRLARMVVDRHYLTNFRVRGVYSPVVYRELVRPWKQWGDQSLRLWDSQDDADRVAQWWNSEHVAQRGVRQPRQRGDLIGILAMLAYTESWQPIPFAVARLVRDLFGDPPDPANVIGSLLRDQTEVSAIRRVLDPMQAINHDIGSSLVRDDYLNHRSWPEVVIAARAAHSLLTDSSAGTADQLDEPR